MLFSIAKDSACQLHLARKSFHPAPPPFPLLRVDTTWKFQAMYALRESMAQAARTPLHVWRNPDAMARTINPFDHGSALHTAVWKTEGLKQALDRYRFDLASGGARRDEERSRAKEGIFSFRNSRLRAIGVHCPSRMSQRIHRKQEVQRHGLTKREAPVKTSPRRGIRPCGSRGLAILCDARHLLTSPRSAKAAQYKVRVSGARAKIRVSPSFFLSSIQSKTAVQLWCELHTHSGLTK